MGICTAGGTEFPQPEPGNHHAIWSRLHTLDDLSTTLTFFPACSVCPALSKAPVALRALWTFLWASVFDLQAAEKMEGLRPSRLTDLPEVRQRVSGGPRSPVSGKRTKWPRGILEAASMATSFQSSSRLF